MKTSSGETSVVAAMEELGKKYEINHKCANANTKHFLTKLSLEYTDLNGKDHTITDGNAPSAVLAYTDPHNGDKLWDGTAEEEEAIEAKIENLFSQVEAGDVDYSEEITIKADYYQPYTPAVTTYYYHYFDKAGNERYAKVYDSTTDAESEEEKVRFFKVNTNSNSEDTGKFTFPGSILVGRSPSGGFMLKRFCLFLLIFHSCVKMGRIG